MVSSSINNYHIALLFFILTQTHTTYIQRKKIGVGVPIHFCSRGSRWRKFAFDKVDGTAAFDYYHIEETSTEGRYLISLNGQPRAEVTSVETTSGQTFNVPGTYESCGAWEYVGGPVKLKINGVCK